jgi:hypothetical protein
VCIHDVVQSFDIGDAPIPAERVSSNAETGALTCAPATSEDRMPGRVSKLLGCEKAMPRAVPPCASEPKVVALPSAVKRGPVSATTRHFQDVAALCRGLVPAAMEATGKVLEFIFSVLQGANKAMAKVIGTAITLYGANLVVSKLAEAAIVPHGCGWFMHSCARFALTPRPTPMQWIVIALWMNMYM